MRITGGAFNTQAAPSPVEVSLGTGCTAIVISSDGQTLPAPNPCAGKLVPPKGRGRVIRFKAGNIEAIDVSKELIAGPNRIDSGGVRVNDTKLPVQRK